MLHRYFRRKLAATVGAEVDYTAPTASGTYSQSEMQEVMDALAALVEALQATPE